MKKAVLGLALIVLVAAAPAVAAPALSGQVIVVLRDGTGDPAAIAAEHAGAHDADIRFIYRNALRGYAARLGVAAVRAVAADPRVAFVSPDTPVRAATTQNGATWGLDRSDQRALPLSGTYTYGATGAGVTAYIIDTGIRTTHTEFGGRASWGTDAVDGSRVDCNGHGTHVAGTVGGAAYGIAKGVTLIAVRVLNCDGDGTTSGVVAGIDWVTGHHTNGPAVANMSLGGGANTALDTAVRNSIADGITYAVAAGNGDLIGNPQDACNYSPARTAEAITVGATQNNDRKASFSNYGACLDLFAPGVDITSSWSTSDTSTNTIDGTSMATPHVAGAAALYLQAVPSAAPAAVRDALYAATTKSIVTQSSTANNHLLFVEQGGTLSLSRTSISFGEARTGTTTAAQAVTVTNSGTSAFPVASVSLAGAHPGDFAETADTCTGVTLNPGATCEVAAAFAPQVAGARTASLQISSGAAGSPHAVALAGTATAPAITVTPPALAFGNQGTGVTSAARSVTVRNSGTAPLAVGAVSSAGAHAADFALSADPCSGATLQPNAFCTLSVTFTPGADGARSASLSIPSDAGAPASVTLTGTGVTPTPGVTLSATALAFGDRPVGTTSVPRQVTVTSSGTAPLSIGSVGSGAPFPVTGDACSGVTLQPGATCVVAVAVAPTTEGARSGSLTIATNAPSGTATVALSGTGTPPAPEVRLSPASVQFGGRPVGSTGTPQQVTVTNIGSADLHISTLSRAGDADFTLTATTCNGATLAPAASCTFSAGFTPATYGARAGAIVLATDATLGPDRATLAGVGLGAAAQVTPASLAFGEQPLGAPASLSVRIQNIGNASLNIGAAAFSGAHPGDFARAADACSSATIAPGASCTASVVFTPAAVGARSATLTFPSNAVGAPATVALSGSGLGDATPPVSRWLTRDLEVKIGSLTTVSGAVTDDRVGVASVTVTFTPAVGAATTVAATLGCGMPVECGFTAPVPLTPGVYTVRAVARDHAGNVENPGPTTRIIVV